MANARECSIFSTCRGESADDFLDLSNSDSFHRFADARDERSKVLDPIPNTSDDDRTDSDLLQILLVLQLCVCCDDDSEPGLLGRAKEHTIPQAQPTFASIRRYAGDGELLGQFYGQ